MGSRSAPALRWLLEPGLPARGTRLHPPTNPSPRCPVPEHAPANDGEIEVLLGHAAEGLAAVLRTERRRFDGRVPRRPSEATMSHRPGITPAQDEWGGHRDVGRANRRERFFDRARRASTAAAERARETSKVAQQWWGRARQRIAKQTSAGVEFGRLKREQLNHPREIARRERGGGGSFRSSTPGSRGRGRSPSSPSWPTSSRPSPRLTPLSRR